MLDFKSKKMVENTETRGGKRKGAGRPKKFNDPANIGFRIERKDKDKLVKKYGRGLNDLFRDWVKTII